MQSSSSEGTLSTDLAKGLRWGVAMATVFATFAVIGRLLGGSKVFGGPTLLTVLLAEFGSGIVGGLIVGASYRSIHSIFSAGTVGLIVGLVCGVAVELADPGAASWRAWDVGLILVYGVLGVVIASMLWRRWRKMYPSASR
jgi:hypothetical protein